MGAVVYGPKPIDASVATDEELEAAVDVEEAARVAADATLIPLSQKGAPDGVAALDGSGRVPLAQLPPIATTETVHAANQAAMLALSVQQGDIAVRDDTNETFVLSGTDPTNLAHWTRIAWVDVSSVNGRTGVVTGLAEQSDLDAATTRITTVETALPTKADLVGGTVPDAQIPLAIARDTEVASSIAAHAAADAAHPAAKITVDPTGLLHITGNRVQSALSDLDGVAEANATAIAQEAVDRAAGDDLALVKAANLADLADVAEARLSLQLGTAAIRDTGTGAAQVVLGNDARLTDQRVPPDGSVTVAKLAFDPATQTELNAETTARQAADTAEATARANADALLVPLSQKGAANGVASLGADGKVPSGQLPPLTTADVFVVNSEAEMLALAANQGDMAIRNDESKTYILTTNDPTVLANWAEMLTPTSSVTSVNTRTGAVTGLAEQADLTTEVNNRIAGDDLAAKKANNLSDLADAPTARTNLGLGTAAEVDTGTGAGNAILGNDARLTDARTPTAHAASHGSAGSDPVTIDESQVTNLTADLNAKVAKSTFDANTILKADTDNVPIALTVGASTFVGRAATGGIAALTAAQAKTVLAIGVADVAGLGTIATHAVSEFDASGAAQAAQDFAIQRANHTGSQPSSTISDLTQTVQDIVGALLVEGANVDLTYDGIGHTLIIAVTGLTSANISDFVEKVQDTLNDLALAGAGLASVYDDVANTYVLSVNVDNSSIEINADTLRVKAGGITNAMLAGSIANSKLATDPLARANHTGTQTMSTISDAGTAATRNVPAAGDASATEVVKGNDTRLTNARTPTAHAGSHASGGTDPISIAESQVGGLVADLAARELTANKGVASGYPSLDAGTKIPIAQIPTGTSATTVTIGNDARLSDQRVPTDGSVTLAKMANLAANSFIGNNTGVAATPVALSAAQAKTLLAIASGDVSGLGALATKSTIANADVAAGAAIAYSKLSLTTSIVNGDIAAGAAIAYSKLSLTGSIVTGDLVNNAVTNAKAAQMPASTIKGNDTGATANAKDLTVAETKALLAITESDVSGLTADLAARAKISVGTVAPSGPAVGDLWVDTN